MFEFNDLIIKCSRKAMFPHVIDRLKDYDIVWIDGMKLEEFNPYEKRRLHDEQTIYIILDDETKKIQWCDTIWGVPTKTKVIASFSELNLILKELFVPNKKPFEDLTCDELKCEDCPFEDTKCDFIINSHTPFGEIEKELNEQFGLAKKKYEEEDDDEE